MTPKRKNYLTLALVLAVTALAGYFGFLYLEHARGEIMKTMPKEEAPE